MKKMKCTYKKIFSTIAVLVAALSLVLPSFAATPTVYQVSNFQTDFYSDENGNTIYTYDLSTSSYLHKYVLGVKGTNTGIYSIFNWNGNTQYPFYGTWNATYSGDLSYGTLPPVYNFGSFMAGNTVTLSFALKLNNIANIQGYCSFYLFLSNTYLDFTDIWDDITLDGNGRASATLKDINAVVDSKTINLSDIQNGETFCTVTFDFAIDTFQGNLFPTIGFFIPSNVSGTMYSLGCEISRTYPTSGIILENTQTIIDQIGEQNEYIEQISGDLTVVKASLDTVKSTLSTISSRINTTNTRLNTLHNDLTHLENTLTENGQTPEFSSDETLPVEDIEDANQGIESAQTNFNNFFSDYFLHSNVGSWFSQLWDTLLDSSGVGTPFLFLTPAALFLIVRSLFGR